MLQGAAWCRDVLEGRVDLGDYHIPKGFNLESLAKRYIDQVSEAWAAHGQVLVRINCDQDRHRHDRYGAPLGTVFESPLGPLLQIQTALVPPSTPRWRNQWTTSEYTLLAQPPGPWWVPSLRCLLHGDGPVSVDQLLVLAAKAASGGPPGRVAVSCRRP